MAGTEHRPISRGRVAKREAILDAAMRVFVEDGYPAAGIDRIATLAGVSKPTVYNHFDDKESLFRTVMRDGARLSATKIISAFDTLSGAADDPGGRADIAAQLAEVALLVLDCQLSDEGWTLQRLLYAEAARMPDLYDEVVGLGGVPVRNALAGWLARLANRGLLEIEDPDIAASQFMALIAGDLPAMSALGTRPIGRPALVAAVDAGVRTFLRAFAPRRRSRAAQVRPPATATRPSTVG
ncbi:TetR/AcrR family transcriptional regulator [Frankia sp. Ag45/Mut15]|uniref:TetR/AcrR family transcriptional regulator n=1 Tax=Frankia umida TaxID=573489 RepID=A0ABT0K3F3_9ACTN|nr:TetR/AcrR family transcriptional regulator [Frankia umida]MCK9878034.1 TetR/AcrR family transcriptional regulator [Frankia umida]